MKIIALGLIIITSTGILIDSLGGEISQIASIIESDQNIIALEKIDNSVFKDLELAEIYLIMDQYFESDEILPQFNIRANIVFNGVSGYVPVHISNFSQISIISQINALSKNVTGFITEELVRYYKLEKNDKITLDLSIEGIPNFEYYHQLSIDQVSPIIDSGIHLNSELLDADYLQINQIKLIISSESQLNRFISDISSINNVEVITTKPESEFLLQSNSQIIEILIILQSIISLLVIMSIFNIFNQLIAESKHDIRVLRAVGYSRNQIKLLFVAISFVMGIISFFLSIIVSFILVSFFVSLLILFFNFSSVFIVLKGGIVMISLINSMIVSILSSYFSVQKGVV